MLRRWRRPPDGRLSTWRRPIRTRAVPSKEDLARQIAERDGVTEGLVCVLSAVEPCRSFAVIGDRATCRLRVARRSRKCLHYYLYLIDPEFGWMHVRVQTWAPYQIQVYVNGREWLARQLDVLGVGYRRSGNKITAVDDLPRVEDLCRQFARTDWPRTSCSGAAKPCRRSMLTW